MPLRTSGCCCLCNTNNVPIPSCAGNLTGAEFVVTGIIGGPYSNIFCGKAEEVGVCQITYVNNPLATNGVVAFIVFVKTAGVWHLTLNSGATIVSGHDIPYWCGNHLWTDLTAQTDVGAIDSTDAVDFLCHESVVTVGGFTYQLLH